MSFEKNLLHGIPLEEAAGFFLRIRGKDKEASVADFNRAMAALPEAARAALLKAATAMPMAGGAAGAMPMTSPAAMPPTARGQNMRAEPTPSLPPTAMGQNTSPGMKMAADKSPGDTGKERAHASLSAEFEKEKHHGGEAKGGLVGKLLGGAAGAAAMHRYGKGNPVATLGGAALGEHLGGQVGKHFGAGHDRKTYEKHATAFKLALQETPGLAPEAPQGIEPALDPATQQALALMQQGDAAAEQGESSYLRQQLEALRQQSAAAVEQAETLQAQQEQTDAQTAQMQAQVADATQKAMDSQDQVLQQQQAAAAMRMAFQELRGQLLEAASAEPPSLTPSIGSQAQAAQAAASQAAGPSSAPAPTAGPAGAAPNPGVPPAGMAPEGDDTVSTPASKNEPTFEGASATTQMGQKEPSGDAKIPNKEVLASASVPLAKTADLRQILSQIGSQVGEKVRAVAPHAALGAALGAGAGAVESRMSNEPLRQGVAALEAKPDRGYKDTLNLAQKRARLTVGDFVQKHPGMAVGLGALGGASLGASAGPGVVSSLKRSAGHIQGIGQELRNIQSGAA
jgi:hypothetical protein